MRPRHCYGRWPELELLGMGCRVAYAYDEDFEVAYRLAAAIGLERRSHAASVMVLELQRRWSAVRVGE